MVRDADEVEDLSASIISEGIDKIKTRFDSALVYAECNAAPRKVQRRQRVPHDCAIEA